MTYKYDNLASALSSRKMCTIKQEIKIRRFKIPEFMTSSAIKPLEVNNVQTMITTVVGNARYGTRDFLRAANEKINGVNEEILK